ncbi:uncharacterized protein KNAG_0J01850 [Huiozyma naganishii CBS 8797]|uniref:TAP-C domain-containing protein n=1 Tax=Huiozyma naganishii (strain ATCC MYA-139 / BCRC 22969 / CBS 8797 / KCTC 17520 / NBRC 10181 / NCYC 3082 / Yp74L-3) TaxID=1071383 RepID=J7SAL0_HUIN7|nr:hypothetical protein KNAG_0J01850 [Kazachstania naganishii CBS 8797]CCK72266.1 hypothetical protein KNAG_0J01850 [Kazachstania naganishii CBS 8797]
MDGFRNGTVGQRPVGRMKVGVRNWQNATLPDLVNFVSRNTGIALLDPIVEGPLVIGYVATPMQADQLVRWSGVNFAGGNLVFEAMGADTANTSHTIEFLRSVVLKRYDPTTRLLNLGDLYSDPDLQQKGMLSSVSTRSRTIPALVKIASQDPAVVVESINLAGNRLKDLACLESLPEMLPRLKNLCLANNLLASTGLFEFWRRKFRDLSELLMVNNPVTKYRGYKSDMLAIFPKLVILDSVVVRDATKVEAVYKFPFPPAQFFFEDNQLGPTITDFVTNFLNCWDSDRNQLMGLYMEQSQFSLCLDSSAVGRNVSGADQSPPFGHYLTQSRNTLKVSSAKTLEQRLGFGQSQISTIFRYLPRSRHHLLEQPTEYKMESFSFPQVNGFVVCLHGYFEETEAPELKQESSPAKPGMRTRRYANNFNSNTKTKLSKKSFDRVWTIVPVSNGGLVIASELLTVRAYAPNAWSIPLSQSKDSSLLTSPPAGYQPLPSISASASPGIPPPMSAGTPITPTAAGGAMSPPTAVGTSMSTFQIPPDVQARLNPMQLDTLAKIHQLTKLNAEYTFMLAEQSGWNLEVAMTNFQNSAATLPANAFT